MTTAERPHVEIEHGEVAFPLWVKVIAWIIGLCFPVAVIMGGWVGTKIWDVSIRMARVEIALQSAADDRYRGSQARDAHALLQERIDRNADNISELQRLHGRQSGVR